VGSFQQSASDGAGRTKGEKLRGKNLENAGKTNFFQT
jgi:hypothetical protein